SAEDCSHDFYFDRPTNVLSSERANFNGDDPYPRGRAPKGKSVGRPTRVGAYPPNKLGLCDMHGNVFQWCADAWPAPPSRVLRGGAWGSPGDQCRACYFLGGWPTHRAHHVGFRLARVPATGSGRFRAEARWAA